MNIPHSLLVNDQNCQKNLNHYYSLIPLVFDGVAFGNDN